MFCFHEKGECLHGPWAIPPLDNNSGPVGRQAGPSSWLEHFTQWKQLARAGRRKEPCYLKSDPRQASGGEKLTEKQEARPGRSGSCERGKQSSGAAEHRCTGRGRRGSESCLNTGRGKNERQQKRWGPARLCHRGGIRHKLKHSSAGFPLQGVKYFQMGVAGPCCEDNMSSRECWPQAALVLPGCLGLLTYL